MVTFRTDGIFLLPCRGANNGLVALAGTSAGACLAFSVGRAEVLFQRTVKREQS